MRQRGQLSAAAASGKFKLSDMRQSAQKRHASSASKRHASKCSEKTCVKVLRKDMRQSAQKRHAASASKRYAPKCFDRSLRYLTFNFWEAAGIGGNILSDEFAFSHEMAIFRRCVRRPMRSSIGPSNENPIGKALSPFSSADCS